METTLFCFTSMDTRWLAFDFAEKLEEIHHFNTITKHAGKDWRRGKKLWPAKVQETLDV